MRAVGLVLGLWVVVGCATSGDFDLAVSSEVIQAFRSSVSSEHAPKHTEAYDALVARLEESGYLPQDMDEVAKTHKIDRENLPPATREVYLSRPTAGKKALLVHVAWYVRKKSTLTASVVWFAYGSGFDEQQQKAEEMQSDLGKWWALNDPTRP